MESDPLFEESPDADTPCPAAGGEVNLVQLVTAGSAVHESRRRWPVCQMLDVSDLVVEARRHGVEVRLDRCGNPKAAPPSVVTCARRVLELALTALGPPVSHRIDVHLCGIVGQIGIQVTALDRRSHRRLVATETGQRSLAELALWWAAFSPLFSLEPLRRDRANVAAVLPFDCGTRWALPKCSRLHAGEA